MGSNLPNEWKIGQVLCSRSSARLAPPEEAAFDPSQPRLGKLAITAIEQWSFKSIRQNVENGTPVPCPPDTCGTYQELQDVLSSLCDRVYKAGKYLDPREHLPTGEQSQLILLPIWRFPPGLLSRNYFNNGKSKARHGTDRYTVDGTIDLATPAQPFHVPKPNSLELSG